MHTTAVGPQTVNYDANGNLASRSTISTYRYDALDRVTHITHSFVGDTRTFDYAYDNVSNRKWNGFVVTR